MTISKLPPIVNTGVLLATIAQLTQALEAETKLSDRNAELAAKYKAEADKAVEQAHLLERYRDAVENIGLWVAQAKGLR